ncbi:MAG: S1 RNA-binding domain-containing protein [Acidimicrobiia bacterium]|nr:S1 RNA-binding domain-containing protein [Acidimicrobiia bacterium]
MAPTDRHLVVDGSNIATEGRTLPSLAQLDEAVRAITSEHTFDSVTVIVDATFAHRIDDAERDEFEAAVLAGEIVTPPAGAIGRGDAFILQVAEKVGAVVFSNDSFQEFHGEHEWLFEQGRLVGGKPIEGVGWVFVERAPVRGPTSRRSVREAGGRSGARGSRKTVTRRAKATGPTPKPTKATPPPAKKAARGSRPSATKAATPAPATPTAQTRKASSGRKTGPAEPSEAKATKSATRKSPEPLNDPRTFVSFVSRYSIGDEVEATVEHFSSHGCYLRAADAQCYLPSRAMGDPAPSRARDVVSRGQTVIVKVESIDSDRRGINVELVRVVPRDDRQTSKRKEAIRDSGATTNRKRNPAKTPGGDRTVVDGEDSEEGDLTRSTSNVATPKPTAANRGTKATKRPAAKKRTAKKPATATSSARVKRATARKSAAEKSAAKTTKKAPAKKTTAKKATAKKSTAKKTTAKKTTAKKTPAKKAAAKTTTAKKSTAKKTTAKQTTKKAAAKTTTAKKSTAKKSTKKTTAKKTTAKR